MHYSFLSYNSHITKSFAFNLFAYSGFAVHIPKLLLISGYVLLELSIDLVGHGVGGGVGGAGVGGGGVGHVDEKSFKVIQLPFCGSFESQFRQQYFVAGGHVRHVV